jgi:exodeoxyribonuclease V alpha subunit
LYFSKFGLSPEKGARAYKYLGDGAVEKIKNNPYILISDEFGLSFKQADKIAMNENEEGGFFESEARIYSGIRYVLGKAAQSGHTYLPDPVFKEACRRVLGVRLDLIGDEADSMVEAGLLKRREDRIYLAKMYEAEKSVAKKLLALSSVDFGFSAKYEYALTESLMRLHIELDTIQKDPARARQRLLGP